MIGLRLVAPIAAVLSLASVAVAEEWEDPRVNSRNRLPPRAYSMPLADEKSALTDDVEPESPYKLSLNGDWKISWAGNPKLRVKDFWMRDYDDSRWHVIDVPSRVHECQLSVQARDASDPEP